tara:strand:- start:255 stop:1496 length:1242 start_codon:yes stop_codon:yes gene_type:complete
MVDHTPWDYTFPLDGLKEVRVPESVDICTVRSDTIGRTSLGSLFWILVANRLSLAGANVTIYDFPDSGIAPDVLPSQQLVDILGMDVDVVRAEDVDQTEARKKLEEFSRGYSDEEYPGIHPRVAEGLRKSGLELHPSLDRMVEELAVFIGNSGDVQLMAHERETVQLIKYLGGIEKQYWRVDLGGIESEYRAERIPTISEYPDRLMMGRSQGEVYYGFFMHVLEELTEVLLELGREAYLSKGWSSDQDIARRELDRFDHGSGICEQIEFRLRHFFGSMALDAGQKSVMFRQDYVLAEVERGNRAMAGSENPDYNWVLRLLCTASTGDSHGKGIARTIIHSALPTLSADELIYHGTRFWKNEDKGRGFLFFEEYLSRGHTERAEDMIDIMGRSGLARRRLVKLLNERELLPTYD